MTHFRSVAPHVSALVMPLMLLGLALVCGPSLAQTLRLGAPFTDHMVIQAEAPVRVWGWDNPGQSIEVALAGHSSRARADGAGYWKVELPAIEHVGPYRLTVEGSEVLMLEDVVAGEVWWCSGQSNMGWPIRSSWGREWVLKAPARPEIRLLRVPNVSVEAPQDDVDVDWQISSSETVRDFSAVAYFFAHELTAELDRPIGVIQSAWGGSKIRAWLPPDTLASSEYAESMRAARARDLANYEAALAAWESSGRQGGRPPWRGAGPQHALSALSNGMVRPFEPMSIRGVIWYQGESDTHMAQVYDDLFEDLVGSWRRGFDNSELPVFFVQLPNFAKNNVNWAPFRNQQRLTALRLDGVDMAVTIDKGKADDIHPPAKQPVGKRLAWLALEQVYAQPERLGGSPRPVSARLDYRPTGRVLVQFDRVGDGLHTGPGDRAPLSFVLGGLDGSRQVANAEIVSRDTVAVWHPEIAQPVDVRYANHANPKVNLVNSVDLPATPFEMGVEPAERTD